MNSESSSLNVVGEKGKNGSSLSKLVVVVVDDDGVVAVVTVGNVLGMV